MTQEDKELLLMDLSARLPYVVKGLHRGEKREILAMDSFGSYQVNEYDAWFDLDSVIFKPYLFPLSSMTEEQERELIALTGYKSECEAYCGFDSMGYYIKAVGEFEYEEGEHSFMFYPDYVGIDWFNKNHFDYRGLIKKGLAIDATGLNIY